MVVSFLIVAKTKKDLQVYDPESGKSIYTIEKETETEKEIISETYRNETINFTMQIRTDGKKSSRADMTHSSMRRPHPLFRYRFFPTTRWSTT